MTTSTTPRTSLLVLLAIVAANFCGGNGAPQLDAGPATRLEAAPPTTVAAPTANETSVIDKQVAAEVVETRVPSTATTLNLPTTFASPQQQSTIAQQPTTTTTVAQQQRFNYIKPQRAPQCNSNNRTYAIGEKWNEDCEQVCECVSGPSGDQLAISACKPRCPIFRDPPGENCTLLRSKTDECCLEYVCALDAKFAPTTTLTTTLMQNERGPLNLSVTDIRMPSPVATAAATAAPATTVSAETAATVASATTTTTTKPAVVVVGQQRLAKSSPAAPTTTTMATVVTTRQVATQPTTIAATTLVPPTTTAASAPNQRRPNNSARPATQQQVLATQSPSGRPAQRGHSLTAATQAAAAATVTAASRDLRMLPIEHDEQPRGGRPVFQTTTTTTTTTTTPEPITTTEASVDPAQFDLCVVADESGFQVNDSWKVEQCGQTCRCVFQSEPRDPTSDMLIYASVNLRNASDAQPTEIRCSLPARCASLLSKLGPSSDCLRHRLVLPQTQSQDSIEACACPKVECLAPTAPQAQLEQQLVGCKSNQTNRVLAINETFTDECHSICKCSQSGKINCEPLNCSGAPTPSSQCDEWSLAEPDFKPNSAIGKCCPEFVCSKQRTEASDTTPTTTTAAAPAGPKACVLLGKGFPHGARVPEEMHDPKAPDQCGKTCACNNGQIICKCPSIGETPPDSLECLPSLAYILTEECCPRWACPIREDYALQDFQVAPVNSSSIEVSFELPLFAVNRRGKAELNYTSLPLSNPDSVSELPPDYARWVQRPNIRTNDGVFSNQNIKYYLNDLKPLHKYWLKITVRFHDAQDQPPFNEPIESALRFAVLPPPSEDDADLAASSTQSATSPSLGQATGAPTTTTTTTQAPTTTMSPQSTRILQPVTIATHPPTPSPQPAPTTFASPAEPSSTEVSQTFNGPISTTTTTETPPPPSTSVNRDTYIPKDINAPPCSINNNNIGQELEQPSHQSITSQFDAFPRRIEGYAFHLLVAFSIMTILFTIVSYLYLKKSSRVIAPITSQSAYDNPTFTKLVSYYANQPHVLLVDESSQNYNNDVILAKQKNLEVDKSSPLHKQNQQQHQLHQMNDIHHHNGRQHLI